MRKLTEKIILVLFVSLLVSGISFGQAKDNSKVLITGSRFTYPLLDKWIADFKVLYPAVEIRILPRGGASEDSANLVINAHKLQPDELKPNYTTVNIGRYAILPIANSRNPLVSVYAANGIREKEVKELYFQDYDVFHDESKNVKKKEKLKYKPTLYTREQKACAPTAFANHFELKQENLKGKGISGEDKHLIPVVKRDTNALSYNVLNWVYDLKTRKVVDGITVLPIDIDNNGKLDESENVYGNLDRLVSAIESGKAGRIPVDYVNISYPSVDNSSNNNLKLFVKYILNDGQRLSHEFGFIDLEEEVLIKQKELAELSFQPELK